MDTQTAPSPWAPPAPDNAGVPAQVPVPQATQPAAAQPSQSQPAQSRSVQPQPVQSEPVQAQQTVQYRSAPAAHQEAAPTSSTAAPTARSATQSLVATLAKGAIAGAIAGLVSMVLLMYAATGMDLPADYPLLLLASIGQGPSALINGSPVLGAIAHVGFGVIFGALYAVVLRRVRFSPASVLFGALVFSLAIFAVDTLLGPVLRQVLEVRNAPTELMARLVFGAVMALAFLRDRERS